MLTIDNLSHSYEIEGRQISVLHDIAWNFSAGTYTSIQGTSGSGKSTLLNILGLLEPASGGSYLLDDTNVATLTDAAKSRHRAITFGYLFQDFRLIASRTVFDNVMLALEIAGVGDRTNWSEQVMQSLESVGIADRANHVPAELSGGEAQRAALARALVKNPSILLADEPTGNLDSTNRDKVLDLMQNFNESGGTIIMVTHDAYAARHSEHSLLLQNGQLIPTS